MEAVPADWPSGGMADSDTVPWPMETDHYSGVEALYQQRKASWGP